MFAVIMAGGLGTRLRPLTFSIPKPLLPVGEKPILEIILNKLEEHGIRDIIVATGYRAELIKTYFQTGEKFGVRIEYLDEQRRLGTAGALSLIRGKVGADEPVLVMNGDILTKLDFRKMVAFHRDNGAEITVGTKTFTYQVPYGVIDVENGRVRAIREKPPLEFTISAGIYVLNPSVLETIPEDTYYEMPTLIASLIADRRSVLGYPITEYWIAIEQLGQYEEALHNLGEWF